MTQSPEGSAKINEANPAPETQKVQILRTLLAEVTSSEALFMRQIKAWKEKMAGVSDSERDLIQTRINALTEQLQLIKPSPKAVAEALNAAVAQEKLNQAQSTSGADVAEEATPAATPEATTEATPETTVENTRPSMLARFDRTERRRKTIDTLWKRPEIQERIQGRKGVLNRVKRAYAESGLIGSHHLKRMLVMEAKPLGVVNHNEYRRDRATADTAVTVTPDVVGEVPVSPRGEADDPDNGNHDQQETSAEDLKVGNTAAVVSSTHENDGEIQIVV